LNSIIPITDCRGCDFYKDEVKELYEEGRNFLVCSFDEKTEEILRDMQKKGERIKVTLESECPYCSFKLQLPEDFVGLVTCDKCSKAFHIAL